MLLRIGKLCFLVLNTGRRDAAVAGVPILAPACGSSYDVLQGLL